MHNSPFRLPRSTPFGVVESIVEWGLGLKKLEHLYTTQVVGSYSSPDFLPLVLDLLQVDYQVSHGVVESIPKTGPSVVVANHPFGGIEGVALADLLLKHRPDVKVLTNDVLRRIPELRDIFIGVDVLSKNARDKNRQAVEEARQWVEDGHQLLIFPSGEVSSYDFKLKKVIDPKWRDTAATIARTANASVTPVFIEGANGWFFQGLGIIHPILRTLRLVRELINKKGGTISFRIGKTISSSDLVGMDSHSTATNYLRLNTYLLSMQNSDVTQTKPLSIDSVKEKIADAAPKHALSEEVDALPDSCLLINKGDMQVYCATANQLPRILLEIGRLREITFRQVGEGSGKAVDLDQYDDYYLHLFLWNKNTSEVVGAYRIGQIDRILKNNGIHGIYTRSLFRYHANFLHKLGCCLEMGRSFVRPEYQKSLSALMLLWKGIGAYVAANPKYRVLFGPVSISSDYSEVSRQLMAGCLGVNNSDQALADLVRPTTPLKSKGQFWSVDDLQGLQNIEQLSSMVQQIEKDNKGIPVLLRQYLKLSGELAAFNVDPDFNDALDGLIIVDLLRVNERALSKYMGASEARQFTAHHNAVA